MPFEFRLPSLEEMRSSSDGLEMIRMIEDDNFRSALVTGCPGSGKTTVSIYRLVRLSKQNVRVLLVTFQNMLVLAIGNLASVQTVSRDRVSTFNKWFYRLTKTMFNVDAPPTPTQLADHLQKSGLGGQELIEILIDEGQDLPVSVYKALPQFATRFFVGADNGQQVHSHGARTEQIEEALRSGGNDSYRRFALGRNFRNTYQTYAFARQFIPKTNQVAWDDAILDRLARSPRGRGPKPTVISYHTDEVRNEHLKMTLENAEGNVAILCPLASQFRNRSHSGESVDDVHELVTDMGIRATKYHHDAQVPDSLERYVITTFISAKGMEFDVVIVPRINFFKSIPTEWYVACTRARRQLFVYRDLSDPQVDPVFDFDASTYESVVLDSTAPSAMDDIPF